MCKHLQVQILDRYPNKIFMKDQLFYGMHHVRVKGLVNNDTDPVTPNSPVLSVMEDNIDKIMLILKATQTKFKLNLI